MIRRHVPVSQKNPTGITIRYRHLRRLKGTYLDLAEIESIFINYDRKGIVYQPKEAAMLKMLLRIFPLILLIPRIANANVGIPVVAFGLPLIAANLIFIVLIEAFVLKKLNTNLGMLKTVKQVFLANLITTLIGYPLVAILEAMTAIFGINLGWLLPFENLGEMKVYIGTAMLLTLIPCYFLSVWIEGSWLKRRLSSNISWKNIFAANFASYLFLTVQVYTQFPIHPLNYGKYTIEYFYGAVMSIIQLFSGGQ